MSAAERRAARAAEVRAARGAVDPNLMVSGKRSREKASKALDPPPHSKRSTATAAVPKPLETAIARSGVAVDPQEPGARPLYGKGSRGGPGSRGKYKKQDVNLLVEERVKALLEAQGLVTASGEGSEGFLAAGDIENLRKELDRAKEQINTLKEEAKGEYGRGYGDGYSAAAAAGAATTLQKKAIGKKKATGE